MNFKDHFSSHAASYAGARPTYPGGLLAFLAGQCRQHELALDCATGNGQAALALAASFDRVIASDASQSQLDQAPQHPNVEYRCHPAEDMVLPPRTVDMITVAQALHWFDLDRFFASALAMLKPQGLLAVWSYGLHEINPAVDRVCARYYHDIVGPYWPDERRIVEAGYADIDLPLPLLHTPQFVMNKSWQLDELFGYLLSWSATQRYMKARRDNPLLRIEDELRAAWGDGSRLPVRWPLTLKLCRNP